MLFDPPLVAIAKQKINADQPTGVNIRMTPEFQELKTEMQKKIVAHNTQPVNWSLIAQQAKNILETQSKDILVAAYLIVAWIYLYQLRGWGEAFEFFVQLLKKYGKQLQPMDKPKVHGLALDWLSTQLNDLFLHIKLSVDIKQLTALVSQITVANDLLKSTYDAPVFSHLITLLNERISQLKINKTDSSAPVAEAAQVTLSTEAETNPTVPALTPAQLAGQLLAMGATLLATDPTDPVAYYFRRTGMWGYLRTLPSYNEKYQSIIQAPSLIQRNQLQAVIQEPDTISALRALELLAGDNPFWLDVQRAISGLISGKPELLSVDQVITQHNQLFIQRFPELAKLKFTDGSALCDEQTTAWLQRLMLPITEMPLGEQVDMIADLERLSELTLSMRKRLLRP